MAGNGAPSDMPSHTVQQGDTLAKIARMYGFREWKPIYEHGNNADFRKKRPNPNVIFPGDVLWVPEKTESERDALTGKRHTFRVPASKRTLRLRFLDAEGQPVANQEAVLEIDGREPIGGEKTDTDGKIEFPVQASDTGGRLTIAGRAYVLDFNHLNPVDDTPDEGLSGIQGRLLNLGYYNGSITDTLDRPTRVALLLFQHDHNLEMTGKPDAQTVNKLVEQYGC